MVSNANQTTPDSPVNQGVHADTSEPNNIGASTPFDFAARNLTAYGRLLRRGWNDGGAGGSDSLKDCHLVGSLLVVPNLLPNQLTVNPIANVPDPTSGVLLVYIRDRLGLACHFDPPHNTATTQGVLWGYFCTAIPAHHCIESTQVDVMNRECL